MKPVNAVKVSQLSVVFLLALVYWGSASAEQSLLLKDVLQSSVQHFPKINAELAKKTAQEAAVLRAEGAFDPKVKQESLFWASGFYDGAQIDTKVEKPLRNYNARIAGGYRISDGSFPIYQDELITRSGGEFNLEFWFSALRNRDIDDRRVNLRNQILSLTEADFRVLLTQMKVQLQATRAYWQWLGSGKRLTIYQSLLDLAKKRQTALEEQNRLGEVADILLVENERNILTRQSLVRAAQRDFRNAAVAMSLYYRDQSGKPKLADVNQLIDDFPNVDVAILEQVNQDLMFARDNQVEIAILNQQIKQQKNLEDLAENSLLPQVDVGVKAARDIGTGSRTLFGNDLILQMSVEVPLATRQQRGQISGIRAKLDELEFDKQLIREKFETEVNKLVEVLEADIEFTDLTSRELSLAAELEEAEKVRFSEGASDFFLINLREQQTADARVRYNLALEDYFTNLANYYAATAQVRQLGIETNMLPPPR